MEHTSTACALHTLTAPPPPPLCDIPLGCCFSSGALDSHPFVPSHVASGRCVVSAAVAGAPVGVVSAFAEPRRWCAGAALDVAGCAVCTSAAPSSWRIGGCGGRLTGFAVPTPPSSGRPQPASLRFRVHEAQGPCSSTRCPGCPPHTLPHSVGRACRGRVPCWLRVACASTLHCDRAVVLGSAHPGFVGGSFPCLAHHSFPQCASGAPAVAHWVQDPLGTGEQWRCAAGGPMVGSLGA